MKIQIPRSQSPDPRAHRLLFAEHSPFRTRTVENKRRFRRHQKHRVQLAAQQQ